MAGEGQVELCHGGDSNIGQAMCGRCPGEGGGKWGRRAWTKAWRTPGSPLASHTGKGGGHFRKSSSKEALNKDTLGLGEKDSVITICSTLRYQVFGNVCVLKINKVTKKPQNMFSSVF